MSGNAAAISKTKSPRCAVKKAPPCWLKLESPDPLDAIAAEPLPGAASPPPLCPEADKVAAPRRSVSRRPTQCTIGYRHYDVDRNGMRVGRQVPSLRLHGLWLEGLGFAVGDKVRITMAKGALLITAVPAEPTRAAKTRRKAKPAPSPCGL
ncbi:SymE family type I addiction module toxin [Xanthomonas sp. 3307]|uniref:SymE family type I addiction module toxin n=1 Tax=Xanthomonas sp. 3307 TaxID=3035316 RepID=UPI001C848849|nr:SymE family type I addiction module toxin [Xanthomonas sp. 3307]